MVDKIVSALVILKAADGTDPDPSRPITSKTIEQHRPDPRAVAETQGLFIRWGFDVGPLGGISFTITGSMKKFEQLFDISIRERASGEVGRIDDDGGFTLELSLETLPRGIRVFVSTITFSPLDHLQD